MLAHSFILGALALGWAPDAESNWPQNALIDLGSLRSDGHWLGATSAYSIGDRDGRKVVQCEQPGQHVIWLNGLILETGTIEFDAKGRSQAQSSFVGVAFRVSSESKFDAVYFRPFNFRADDPARRARAVQYVSEPAWPWERLRAEKPGQFENTVHPAPDGDAWFHAKVAVGRQEVRVWIDGAEHPSLAVNLLSEESRGAVGLICIGHGMIANLKIMQGT